MRRNIEEFVDDMRSAEDVVALRDRFSDSIAKLGFTTFVYGGMHIPQFDSNAVPYIVTTFPESWQERYFQKGYYKLDPLIARGLQGVLPLKWSDLEREPLSKPQTSVMHEARDHGLEHGFTVPVHGHGGEFGLISIVSGECHGEFDRLLDEHQHQLHLMSIYLHSAIQTAIEGDAQRHEAIKLTPREVDACYGAHKARRRGKSA